MSKLNMFYDKEFRQQLRAHPEQALRLSSEAEQKYKYVVKTNTKTTQYFVFPSPSMLDSDLLKVQAARAVNARLDGFGTAGTMGSAGTAGCISTTVGTIGSIGSLATAGTVSFHADISGL